MAIQKNSRQNPIMDPLDITSLKDFFAQGTTKPIPFRKTQLRLLLSLLNQYESKLIDALYADLGKSPFEAYATEIGLLKEEIKRHLRQLKNWSKPEKVLTPITSFPASSYIESVPYGVSLIISPWNYPVQLTLLPLVGAMSAGNCALIKPSEYTPHTARVLDELINNNFNPNYLRLVQGDAKTSHQLLKQPFDFIFFTGSTQVGKVIQKAAAEQLIPTVLELGGKSPCIVDQSANIKQAARRIMWGKTINAGQTCIAPDYLLVHESIKEQLTDALRQAVKEFFGSQPLKNKEYPKIVQQPQYERLKNLLEEGTTIWGGTYDDASLKIEPTLISLPNTNYTLMQEEIFGPILPVISFKTTSEALEIIHKNPKPLAMYIFSKRKSFVNEIKEKVLCGGITINDTLMQFTNANLPFGGAGPSGIGAYHGKQSFITFSHQRGVMKRGTWLDIPLRYPPFGKKLRLIKMILK